MQASHTYTSPVHCFSSYANNTMTPATYGGSAAHMTHYKINGTGRDTYIYNQNGGFCRMYEPVKYPKVGTFSFGSIRAYREPAPAIQGKNIYYKANGTGRDGYIE